MTKDDVEEDFEKAELIYGLVNGIFNLNWNRITDIDQKASTIIGFIGLIVSLYAGLGSFFLEKFTNSHEFTYFYLLFILGIVALMCSIICGLKALEIRDYEAVPDPKNLIDKYLKNNDKKKLEIIRVVTVELSNAFYVNKMEIDKRTKAIKNAYGFLILGVALVAIFVSSLLLI
jgi:hypothetical protein